MADTTKPNTAPTFTVSDGKLTTGFEPSSTDIPRAVAQQQDGKLLVAGSSNGKLALARYNKDGSLDTSFSGDGKLTAAAQPYAYVSTVEIAPQADGKVLVTTLSGIGFVKARYLSNGDLDTTYGTNGTIKSVVPSWSSASSASDMAIQANGQIVTSGNVYNAGTDIGLNRYNPNGTIDTNFGANGNVSLDLSSSSDTAQQLLVQPDGKILISAIASSLSTPVYTLIRLDANGELDTSFSGDGKAALPPDTGSASLTSAMALQADGKILVGGSTYTPDAGNSMMLVRYTADGNVDTSFNGAGSVTLRGTAIKPALARAISIQKDGNILAVGTGNYDADNDHIIVVRFMANGTLDQGFGNNGIAEAIMPRASGASYGDAALPSNVLVQSDGKILVVGDTGTYGSDFLLVRFNADGSVDQTFSPPANTLDGTPTFSEPWWFASATPVVLDPDVQILDTELAAANSYGGANLTLSRHAGASADDVFSALAGGTLSTLTAGSYFSVDSTTIGRVTTNGAGTLTLTFASNATQALVNKTMQQIAYANLSDAPPNKVQIDWTFSDGNTAAQGTGGTLKATGSTLVTIIGKNDDPLLNQPIPDQKISTGVGFTYVIPADSFADPDHDALSYSIVMSDGSGLPPWLSFDAATRTLSGKPDPLDAGRLTIRVTVRDPSGGTATNVFSLDIATGSSHVDGTTGADKLVGTAGADRLQGFAGNDTLDGKAGADVMIGGDGNDIYYVDNAGDTISETATGGTDTVYTTISYRLAPNVEYARALSSNQVDLVGNELANVLYAGDGNNVLDGGLGNDTASYAYATAGVTVSLGTTQAQDTEGSGVDTLRNIENLAGSRYDDNLLGNQANNTLNGGTGADFMAGGNGSDVYIVDNAGDMVRETNADSTPGGIDTVNSSISYTLGANVENLTLTGTNAINATGNALANKLVGNSGNNVLAGGLGADVMQGGLGNDTYYVDNSGDVVTESAGGGTDTVISTVTRTLGDNQENLTLAGTAAINGTGNGLDNTITGNSGRNVLTGGAGADRMYGGLGDDTLIGGQGKDVLEGGSGSDVFVLNAASESGTTSATWDVVNDFVRGQDKIDLRGIDANTATVANDAFTAFIASTAAFKAAGQLKLLNGVLYGNTDADADAEFAIQLTGITQLTTADVVL